MTLYLVRHGETEWNLEQRRQGRADSSLTERGREQVRAGGRALRAELGERPDVRLCTSPIGRARQSARIVAHELGLQDSALEIDERLAECDLGDWTGLTSDQVEARDPGALGRREGDKWSFRMPSGESYVDLDVRARHWLAELSGARPVIAVTHEMLGRALCGAHLGLAPEQVLALRLGHGVAQRLTADEGGGCGRREELRDPRARPEDAA